MSSVPPIALLDTASNTLSSSPKSILKSINEPLDFKLFYTKQIGDINPVYQNYYDRVKEILEQYVLLSNNKIKLKIFLLLLES